MNEEQYAIAAGIRKRSEAALDQMAKTWAAEKDEDYYAAYDAVCKTDLGRQALTNLEDATAMMSGAATSFDLEKLARTIT